MLKKYPVRIIQTHKNLGLEGWNIGCREAKNEILLIIDDDSHPITSIESELKEFDDPKIAIIAPKILNDENKIQWPRFLSNNTPRNSRIYGKCMAH